MELKHKLEAILFYEGVPIAVEQLCKMLDAPRESIEQGLSELGADLEKRGIRLIDTKTEVMLATAPEAHSLIKEIEENEHREDISKAAAETLAIILYKGPLSRSEIDYIRGVNSGFILRNLLVRGLIERMFNPSDERSFLYKPTLELMAHLGISRIEELPEFDKVKHDLATFLSTSSNIGSNETS